ncbi:MAG TPA: sensor histidine kinase [Chthoniobacter sp.]|nr:sensor histidine kinase [Chthoniobacter sp.]
MSIAAHPAVRAAILAMAVLLCAGGEEAKAGLEWLSPELRQLGDERGALQQRLTTLPPAPEPQVTQRLGWHSDYSASPDTVEWVELNIGHAEPLDAVVLIAPPPTGGAIEPGYGFPLRFRVELLGDDEKTERSILADYTRADFPNPGLLPVVIPVGGKTAHKVRITATRLFRENKRYLCAFGEVMLWQGQRNLGADLEIVGPNAVRASSSQGTRPDWGRINVVDGHTVLGPPIGTQPSPTLGFRGRLKHERAPKAAAVPWVSVDLGAMAPIEEVRLFPAHPPQFAHSHGYGFPVQYQIELRETEDGEPVILPAPQSGDYIAPPGDNVVTVVAGGKQARFVRLTALEQHVSNGGPVFALAEMQVWSGGKNIAVGQSVSASDHTDQPGWSDAGLVDGFTSSADIVDWPTWLAGLSQRREVEQRLAAIELRRTALTLRWQHAGLIGLAGLVVTGGIVSLVWLQRQRRQRQAELEALRQRIARDLHDEIGSSLGSIALIAQDILADGADAAQVRADLGEIKDIADETVSAMRDITRLIQSDRYGTDDLATLLRETAGRVLRGIDHTLAVEEGSHARALPVDRQRDLILMFKETLHNITRHAGAKTVQVQLAQGNGQLTLTVRDDGRGFDPIAPHGAGMGLTNLQRRAAKHGGNVQIDSAPTRGTTVSITLPLHA